VKSAPLPLGFGYSQKVRRPRSPRDEVAIDLVGRLSVRVTEPELNVLKELERPDDRPNRPDDVPDGRDVVRVPEDAYNQVALGIDAIR
jgi:hypothetical protein